MSGQAEVALAVGLSEAMARHGFLSTSDLWGRQGHNYALLVCLYLEVDRADRETS